MAPGTNLPTEVANANPGLGRVLAAQVRALGNHAEGGPSSEACARLLGASLSGGFELESGSVGLVSVLRHRVGRSTASSAASGAVSSW